MFAHERAPATARVTITITTMIQTLVPASEVALNQPETLTPKH